MCVYCHLFRKRKRDVNVLSFSFLLYLIKTKYSSIKILYYRDAIAMVIVTLATIHIAFNVAKGTKRNKTALSFGKKQSKFMQSHKFTLALIFISLV